ncbi:5-hydroxytryptamine receptor 4-like [Homarus americanus]|uniref:5-hydroxytryptamine receptor 4-like n=1 Tax=Homarus americanus TaxID=6706 RepID=A0A8J5JKH9_HOMAM|nr:5-hydroxytryptamine receptor 4-like [Homarus americanus]
MYVLNDAPLLPEDSDHKMMPLLMESPQCVLFGTFMIWFASITINLGPTFLSGALAANIDEEHNAPSCPLITGPLRHYVLNVLWIIINVLVLLLTVYHLYKLYRDLSTSSLEAVRIASLVTTMISVTQPQNQDPESREHHQVNNYITRMEREGVERVKMFVVVTVAYVVFWGPLFLVTLLTPSGGKTGLSHEVTLHVAYVHAFVNPALFLALHKGLRKAVTDIMCCHCSSHDEQTNRAEGLAGLQPNMTTSRSSLGGGLTGVLGGPMSASGALSGGLSTSGLSGATALSTAAAQAMPPYSSDGTEQISIPQHQLLAYVSKLLPSLPPPFYYIPKSCDLLRYIVVQLLDPQIQRGEQFPEQPTGFPPGSDLTTPPTYGHTQ